MAKGKQVEIIAGAAGEQRLIIDGEDISNQVHEFTLNLKAGGLPKLTIVYAVDRVTVESAQTELDIAGAK